MLRPRKRRRARGNGLSVALKRNCSRRITPKYNKLQSRLSQRNCNRSNRATERRWGNSKINYNMSSNRWGNCWDMTPIRCYRRWQPRGTGSRTCHNRNYRPWRRKSTREWHRAIASSCRGRWRPWRIKQRSSTTRISLVIDSSVIRS